MRLRTPNAAAPCRAVAELSASSLTLLALGACAAVGGSASRERVGPPHALAGSSEASTDAGAGPAGQSQPLVHGTFTTRAIARRTQGATDVDLWAFVSADVGDPEGGLRGATRRTPWSARFVGRLHADVDGDDGDAFDGLDDRNDGSVVGRVYDAWAAWRSEDEDIALVRFGRQSEAATPVFLVWDGVRVESRPLGDADVVLGAYGGASTHQFESSNDGDRLFGLWAEGRPWRGGSVRLDYIHAEDERALGAFEDDLFGLSVRHRFDRAWRAAAAFTTLGSDARDLDADATWTSADGRSSVRGTYYELFETQSANPLEFDTFSETLFDWFPFRRAGLLGWTMLGERWRLEGGIDARDVDDEDDEGRFNRDVRRLHVTVSADGLLGAGTTVAVTGDDWQSDARDVQSLGATVTAPVGPRADVSVGTYYAAYEVDLVLGTEREDVRTWFASWTLDRAEDLSFDTSYAFQDTEFGEFHTVRVTLRWRF